MSDSLDITSISARAAKRLPVTREEAEFLIRAVSRACKGPYKSEKHKSEYQELRDRAGMFGDNSPGGGHSIEFLDLLNRNRCGADFNDEILKYPLDGQEHLVSCPKCGQEISFRSPVFVIGDVNA